VKRFLFLIAVIAGLTISAHCDENLIFTFNFGDFGAVYDFPLRNNNNDNGEGIFTLFNFGIEDRWTNIGAEFCPFYYYSWKEADATENEMASSFFNFKVYWSVINSSHSSIGFYAGPFASINYAFVSENFLWDKYIFTTGVQAGFRVNYGRDFSYNLLSFETGYRLIDGESKYHLGCKTDLTAVFIMIFGLWGSVTPAPEYY
jgi:hypothetical protein